MRVLQLSPQFVFPADDGGKISIYNTTRTLKSLGCDVTFVTFSRNPIPQNHLEHFKKYADVHVIEYSTRNTPIRIIKSLLDTYPIYLRKHINDYLKENLSKIVSEKQYDVIHAEHSSMAPLALYLKNLLKIPAFLRLQNIEHRIWERYGEFLNPFDPKKYYVARQAKLLKSQEAKMFPQFDMCFTITNEDKKLAESIAPSGNYMTIYPGVDFEKFTPNSTIERKVNEFVHIAYFRWIHNVNAITWLIDEVMPEVVSSHPEVKFNIIGKGTPKQYENRTINRSEFLGYVEDINQYMNRASFFVAPLFVGSGIRIKILEALAMELPVIATSVAAEGIPGTKENGIIIADNKSDFVAAIRHLLDKPDEARRLGVAGRKFAEENFDWEHNISKIFEIYKKFHPQ
ncbi:MAG: glycosyltransferase family 4 protein [Candidatus Kapabacteria bacterium]|nr:glycosyltransferase family 4 protein [Candidatus Kapabacteria bacterium]